MADRSVAASLSAYEPSWRERVGNATYDIARYLGLGSTANRMRNDVEAGIDFIPGVGDAIGVNDAVRDISAGNYGAGAAGLGLAALGGIPMVGDLAARGIRSFDDYLRAVNPGMVRISEDVRPNLGMGDMYGMLPRDAKKVDSFVDPDLGEIGFHRSGDNYFATAMNPDLGEIDVVGYAMPKDRELDLIVVNEAQGRGIGSNLQYLLRSNNPFQQSGGLTEAGEASLRKTYDRMVGNVDSKAGKKIVEPLYSGEHLAPIKESGAPLPALAPRPVVKSNSPIDRSVDLRWEIPELEGQHMALSYARDAGYDIDKAIEALREKMGASKLKGLTQQYQSAIEVLDSNKGKIENVIGAK